MTGIAPDESGWRTVCEPYNVVLMSAVFVVVDFEIVGSGIEAEEDSVALNVAVVVAAMS